MIKSIIEKLIAYLNKFQNVYKVKRWYTNGNIIISKRSELALLTWNALGKKATFMIQPCIEVNVEHVCITEWSPLLTNSLLTTTSLCNGARPNQPFRYPIFLFDWNICERRERERETETEREAWVTNTPNCQNQRDLVVPASKSVYVVTFTAVEAATALPVTRL